MFLNKLENFGGRGQFLKSEKYRTLELTEKTMFLCLNNGLMCKIDWIRESKSKYFLGLCLHGL